MRLRSLATAAAVIALAAPLTSCGFDYATERDLHPRRRRQQPRGRGRRALRGRGLRRRGVRHLRGVAVQQRRRRGAEPHRHLRRRRRRDGATVEAAEFEPVTVPAAGLVNLAEPPADIVLTGDFTAGDFVPLSVDFGNGERISLNVPVVADDTGYWEGMDAS